MDLLKQIIVFQVHVTCYEGFWDWFFKATQVGPAISILIVKIRKENS